MLENGIMTYFATRGFPTTEGGFVAGVPYNAGNHLPFQNGGTLWHELIDIYSEIVDASAAANAAPMGVVISSSANGAVTLNWNDALPTQTYRLYRGTSAASQPVLVASSIAGLTYTDTPFLQTPNPVYYKLVYMNGGVEKGSRVVHAYVSPYSDFTNQHMMRVIDDGGDPGTVDLGKIDTIYNWLVSHGHFNSLEHGVSPSVGVVKNASNIVSKIYDIGTTRLPRGNDLWMCVTSGSTCVASGSTVAYDALKFNGTTPGVTVPVTNFGVFGGLMNTTTLRGGRTNNIRRKWAHTVVASYAKSSASGDTTLLATGEFKNMALQHLAGTPGTISFTLSDDVGNQSATIPVPGSATAPHIIAGTFGCAPATGANPCPGVMTGTLKAYVDGTNSGGTNNTSLHGNSDLSLTTVLLGGYGVTNSPILNTGSLASRIDYNVDPTPMGYRMQNNSTQYDIDWIFNFEDEWSAADVAAFTTLLQGYIAPVPAIAYNLTAFNASACSGSDDVATFAAFNAAALAWQATPNTGLVQLTLPSSGTCKFISGAQQSAWTQGIKQLRVVMNGATLSDGGVGPGFFLGGGGMYNDNIYSTPIATVSKGATSVTLTACPGAGCTAALALFTVGQWALITGIDEQPGGFPSNPAFWNFVLVSAKTATDVQFATTPLTHEYKSTWPLFDAGCTSGGGVGCPNLNHGGPGTMYVLHAEFDTAQEYVGPGTIDQAAVQTYSPGRDITFKNITWTGTACSIPTENVSFKIIKGTMTSCAIEVDKIIDTFTMQDTTIASIDFQSASVKQFTLSGANVTSFVHGSGINNTIVDSTLNELKLGAHSYGASYGQTYILDSSITTLGTYGASVNPINTVGTWAGGTFTSPIASGALSWAVPGANVYFVGAQTSQPPMFQISDVAQSGSNVVVSFSQNGTPWAGGFPTMPLSGGTTAGINVHPAPQITCIRCSGSADMVDLNQAPAGAPIYSYSKRTYANTLVGNAAPLTLWGNLVSADFNVTVNNAGAGTMQPTGQFHNFSVTTAGGTLDYVPIVNLKVAGDRFITPSGVLCNGVAGACSGDTITAPGISWYNGVEPFQGANGGTTSITIEWKTDQGVVNPTQQ
jgi:hypothetical protein